MMPKPRAFIRHRRWTLKTSPELWHPRLSALHPVSSELVRHAYLGIDQAYAKVSRILDNHGIVGCLRGGYRSYAEELWKQVIMHKGKLLELEANAITTKYSVYGLDFDILKEIALIFGLVVKPVVVPAKTYSFDHAITDYTLNPGQQITIMSIKALGHVDIIWEGDGDGVFIMRVYINGKLEEELYTDEVRTGTYAFDKSLEVRLYNPTTKVLTKTSTTFSARGLIY